ncbi:MAG: hypothetical protein N4A35_00710 [Flavobacteriales bacterium]|jgi:uncharacterized iron-regulated protein|nr:hypothetical protein [Flavobacteriales bacterium]
MKRSIFFVLLILFGLKISAQSLVDSASFYRCFNQFDFNDNSIVMIGEFHFDKGALDMELTVLKELINKDFFTVFIEGGNAEAEVYNLFFRTGNDSLLKEVRKDHQQLNFIYEMKRLDTTNAIVFKGFDFERPKVVANLFSVWFHNKKIPGYDIHKDIKRLRMLKGKGIKAIKKQRAEMDVILERVKSSYSTHKEEYDSILGVNVDAFIKIINNPIQPDLKTRDQSFAKLMLDVEKEEGLNKSIFIMGRDHMTKKNSFVPLLLKELPKKYKVSCIALITDHAFDDLHHVMMDRDEKRSIGLFQVPEQKIIDSEFENLKVMIGRFYNYR